MTMRSPVVLAVKFDGERKFPSFSDGLGDRALIDLNGGGDHPHILDAKYAVLWKPQPLLFERLPNLEVIFSAGAGVDHLLQTPSLPDVPIVRFVDPSLTTRMSEWVCLQCLMHLRQQRAYDASQTARQWLERPQPEAREITVGIMGLGVLGRDAAAKLKTLGFNVVGWSRTQKFLEGVECFDAGGLDRFLAQTDFLVGLLPLTEATKGFFNRPIFAKLNRKTDIASPVFINAGRGGSQVESDIIACIDDGTLGGVSLDVFEKESLSPDSPLWRFPNAILTPHVAASSDIFALGKHVRHQIERHEGGLELENLVDRSLGY